MIDRRAARAGGMPAYKWIGNKILTAFQNRMLRTKFSEFHSGYRLYSTSALNRIPFEKNTNDFHFDTEIIVQLVMKNLRITELPIPTYYGDEICHVNGMKYAWDIFQTMLRAHFHEMNLLFDRKFDVHPPEQNYDLKLVFLLRTLRRSRRRVPRATFSISDAARDMSRGNWPRKAVALPAWTNTFRTPRRASGKWTSSDGIWIERNFPVNVSQFDQISCSISSST